MNTSRYGWPVIIAASLHGALFLISSEPVARPAAPPVLTPITLTPPPEDEPVVMPSDEPAEDPSGPVAPHSLEPPSIPDALQEPASRDAFTVPLTPYAPPVEKVDTLGEFRGLPTGPGTDLGGIGRPGLPGVDKLDRVPRALVRRAPAYPDGPRREGADGSVTVEFVVGIDGRVLQAEAVKWTRREFVDPALRAVRDWRFEPGTQNGRKVKFRMAVPIEFVHHAD